MYKNNIRENFNEDEEEDNNHFRIIIIVILISAIIGLLFYFWYSSSSSENIPSTENDSLETSGGKRNPRDIRREQAKLRKAAKQKQLDRIAGLQKSPPANTQEKSPFVNANDKNTETPKTNVDKLDKKKLKKNKNKTTDTKDNSQQQSLNMTNKSDMIILLFVIGSLLYQFWSKFLDSMDKLKYKLVRFSHTLGL
tara:strand:- start:1288 stop:1872 length:585 start_codon:yes stop_codon:yes gene_type:complete